MQRPRGRNELEVLREQQDQCGQARVTKRGSGSGMIGNGLWQGVRVLCEVGWEATGRLGGGGITSCLYL